MANLKNFIVTPSSIWQVPIIKALKKRKFNVYTLDDDDKALGHNFGNKRINIKTSKINSIKNFCKKNKIKMTSLSSDFGLKVISNVENNIKLPNKFDQRKIQLNSNLDFPKFEKIKDLKPKIFNDLKSLIIKPKSGSGSRNIFEIKNFDKLKNFKNFFNNNFFYEEKIEGTEFIFDGFYYNGTIYTYLVGKKIKIKNQFVSYLIHSVKTTKKLNEKMNEYAKIFLKESNYPNGPFHMEFILQKKTKKLFMVETNFRGIGFDIYSKMIKKITGVDVINRQIDLDLNIRIDPKKLINKKRYRNFCFRLIPIKKSGEIRTIKFKKIKKNINIKIFKKIFNKKNDQVELKNQDSSRLGYIYLISKNMKFNLKEYSKKLINNNFTIKYNENN